jgi:hypothetical protein
MPELLTSTFASGAAINLTQASVRLLVALALDGVVALMYRASRPTEQTGHSFAATLVLLTILIALVTQVIGDSVARAFSLVGALSIVRFRTVVRDTQDTAYVIFAVAVGMAVGANDPWVAVIGIVVMSLAAGLLRVSAGAAPMPLPYLLEVRLDPTLDPKAVLTAALDHHAPARRLVSMSTPRKGTTFDVSYRTALPSDDAAAVLLKALTVLQGVAGVTIERVDGNDD